MWLEKFCAKEKLGKEEVQFKRKRGILLKKNDENH